ncbi:MAG TPA: hypothetical protein VM238_18555 [Phycisphaerae bacterium]|nr:hypothetical protein [Phycisphaerae bacterium]
MKTYQRVRERGTVETVAGNPQDRMAAIRAVVEHKQYAKIDGCMIDLFTASAIVAVHDRLNEQNRAKFANMPAPKMGLLAFKLIA